MYLGGIFLYAMSLLNFGFFMIILYRLLFVLIEIFKADDDSQGLLVISFTLTTFSPPENAEMKLETLHDSNLSIAGAPQILNIYE